jgi:acetyl esterase
MGMFMKHLLIVITLFLGTLCGVSCAVERPAKPTDTSKTYVYKTSAGKERRMEIFFPPNHDPAKSKVPGMIFFHGGAWLGGSLAEFRRTCAYFASRGLVCATANYQMLKIKKAEVAKLPAGETHKRVCVIDAKSAIRWFKQHADELGIDPARIITGGTSAGGHISALATMNPDLNDPTDPKGIDTTVVAYIWVNPAFSRGDKRFPEIDLMRYLKDDLPPSIVFWGENDNWKKGWNIAYEKWRSLGTKTIDLKIAPGEKHGFWNHSAQWHTVMLIETDNFLVKHGFLTGEPTLTMPESGEKFITVNPAAQPVPRTERWLNGHAKRDARLQKGHVDILLVGDSITHGWNRHPKVLKKTFGTKQVVNLGHPADKTENIIWRLTNHQLDKISPQVAIVLAGTNNSNNDEYSIKEIAGGVETIVELLRAKLPDTKILLLGIFPRGSRDQRIGIKRGLTEAVMNPQWEKIDRVNRVVETFADGEQIIYLNINPSLLNDNGALPVTVMPDLLHPNEKGYDLWGNAIMAILEKMMGKSTK